MKQKPTGAQRTAKVLVGGAIAIGASCVAAVVAYRKRTESSLQQIESGLHRFAQGDYDVTVEVPPRGPVRDAALQFNATANALANTENMREDFLSTVAHEFKTPLSYIQTATALAQNPDISDEERAEHLKNIMTGTRRLSAMVGSLLEYATASSLNTPLNMERFSLDESLRHVMGTFMVLIEAKGLQYDIDLHEVDVIGNEELLVEAWSNLISNAVKFTPTGGTISVALRSEGDHAIVTVSDTGIGMSEERLRHAFDRFYRSETMGNDESTGLGLAICKAIVDRHNGEIALQSAPNEGTTCTVTLPLG